MKIGNHIFRRVVSMVCAAAMSLNMLVYGFAEDAPDPGEGTVYSGVESPGDAEEPGGGDAEEPGGGYAEEPGGGDAEEPGGGDADKPGGGDAEEPGGGDADKPGGGDAEEPGGGDAGEPKEGDADKPGGVDAGKKEGTFGAGLLWTPLSGSAPVITGLPEYWRIDPDTELSVGFAISDEDTEPEALLVSAESDNIVLFPYGLTVDYAEGAYTLKGTPGEKETGRANITISVSDGDSNITGDITVDVGLLNEAPVITGLGMSVETDEDEELSFGFTVSDAESDPESLTVTISSDNTVLFPDEFIVINTGGVCIANGMPAPNENGGAMLKVMVSDGENFVEENISATVKPINDAPVAADDFVFTDQGKDIDILVLDNDTDADGDELKITYVSEPAHGTAVIAADFLSVVYTPAAGWNGEDSFTYIVSDPSGATDTGEVNVTVEPTTPGPSVELDTYSWAVSVTLTVTGTVPDGGSIAYRVDGGEWQTYTAPVEMTVEGEHTVYARILDISGIPTKTASAVYKLDKTKPSVSCTYDWDGIADSVAATVAAADAGSGIEALKYAEGNKDADYFASEGEELSDPFQFTAEVGILYTIYARDICGNITTELFTVNTSPRIFNLDPGIIGGVITGTEETELSFTFDVGDDESPAGSLVVTVIPDESGIFANPFTVINTDGECVAFATPVTDATGDAVITITVSDGELEKKLTITARIENINDAPNAVDDTAETDEDTSVIIYVLANDTDADGDDLEIIGVSDVSSGSAEVSPDGLYITYTPEENYNGTATFRYTIKDIFDAEAYADVVVTIYPVDDEPVAVDDTAGTDKNIPAVIDVLVNDYDIDGDEITIDSVTKPANGTAVVAADGKSVTYTPDLNWHGTDTFEYEIISGSGLKDTAAVVVTVEYKDYAPVVHGSDYFEVDEDSTANLSFTITDDETAPRSITAQVVSSNTSIVKNEKITITGLGDDSEAMGLVITPEADKNGNVTITIKVSDGFNIGTFSFELNVLPVNDPPSAKDDSFNFTEDEVLTFTAAQLVSNDTDIDGDTLYFAGIVTNVTRGDLVYDEAEGTFTYTPEQDYDQDVWFTYRVSDGTAISDNVGTVTLKCTPVNDEPWITAIEDQTTPEDTTITGIVFRIGDPETAANLLVVSVGSSDPDIVSSNMITVTGEGADRELSITPNENGYGKTDISIIVSDGTHYVTGTFKLTVTPVQDPPSAIDDVAYVSAGESVDIDVLANDYDPDGDTLVIVSFSAPAHGSVSENPDGTLKYTADETFAGVQEFTYEISDGHGNTSVASVHVICTNALHPPVISKIPDQRIAEDGTTGAIAFEVFDSEDLPAVSITKASGNESVVSPEGIVINKISDSEYTVTVTPVADAYGSAFITLTATDSKGTSTNTRFWVYVYPVNDLPQAVDDICYTEEDTPVTFNVLDNDSDIESAVWMLSIANPANGTLVAKGGGEYTYTPKANWNGTETFTYTIMDSEAAEVTGNVIIHVAPVNDAPVARDDYLFEVDFSKPITVNVLANDYDVDGTFEVQSCDCPGAVINPDGTITIPAQDGAPESFVCNYTIIDNEGLTAMASIRLTTEAPPQAFPCGNIRLPYLRTAEPIQ